MYSESNFWTRRASKVVHTTMSVSLLNYILYNQLMFCLQYFIFEDIWFNITANKTDYNTTTELLIFIKTRLFKFNYI